LALISRTLHVPGFHHAHHQEYVTAQTAAAVEIIYECGIVKCSVR
jgi:hypothetical protein